MDGASQARGSQGIGVSRLARSSPSGKDLCVVFVGDDVKSVGGAILTSTQPEERAPESTASQTM